jgi:hypothetical protein
MKKLVLTRTSAGKPKLTDTNGFSVANAPDATKESDENFRRLLLCWKALENFQTDAIKQVLESNSFEFQIVEK